MILWRISNYADLSGSGGLMHHGRWHHRGRPVVYLAESAAGALLEALVHVEAGSPGELPQSYRLLEVVLPDDASMITLAQQVDDEWRQNLTHTRRSGDEWLAAGDSLLLRVPSAIVGRTFNRLFNPAHAQAQACRIVSAVQWPFDSRLLRASPE